MHINMYMDTEIDRYSNCMYIYACIYIHIYMHTHTVTEFDPNPSYDYTINTIAKDI